MILLLEERFHLHINLDGPEENILNFMKEFKVLLVLDNLETLNSNHIIKFLKEVPSYSKVLITSRHGIGELENRYPLSGLKSQDATVYFRELAKYYGLEIHKKPEKTIQKLVVEHLYSNPLSIKWFLTGIYNGISENSLITNKDSLIEFCMSNVFDKLSLNSKKILQLFLVENIELSLGEIDYFMPIDSSELRGCMNELMSTNMIATPSESFKLNNMAKDYLSLYHIPTNEFFMEILNKRKHLNNKIQEIKVRNESDPFNPKSIFKNSKDRNYKLAAYYLSESLLHSSKQDWETAHNYISKAEEITPDYFEVYKIKAFIQAEKRDLFNAMSSYDIALDKCETDFEKASVLYLYSIFCTLKLSEFDKALELLNEAEIYVPDNIKFLLEKARVLMYQGKFEQSETILINIQNRRDELDLQLDNIYVSRFSELYRRKAEIIHSRDTETKLQLLSKGIDIIESTERIDHKTYIVLLKFLKDLSYIYYDPKALNLILKTLKRHYSELKSNKSSYFKQMKDLLISRKEEIPNDIYNELKEYIYNFEVDAKKINIKNEGIIVFMKDHYGFIANSFNSSIYFNISNLPQGSKVGDRVKFTIYTNRQGEAAKSILVI